MYFNQPCHLSCANVVEMMAESDPIFITDVSRSIFSVTLDYELMNPVLTGCEHIDYRESWPFKLSLSDRHSERLYCQYPEKGKEIASEK
jgi:hypothetical protein